MKAEKQAHQSKDKGLRFSGGDHLEGDEKLGHEAMMRNELRGGYGAYQLSFAHTKKSGLSFGGNQMDIHGNEDAQNAFSKILTNATDKEGHHYFTGDEP